MQSLTLGGLSRFSAADWPGRLCAVAFVQGCPWRCGYCHNPGLQARQPSSLAWDDVLAWLASRRGLLDGVVFSGGEPLLDAALPAALSQVLDLGFATGLHTAGIYPERLGKVLPLLQWVGLDVKAALDEQGSYGRLTGAAKAWQDTACSLEFVLDAHRTQGLAYECRTTWHPDWLPSDELLRLARQLRSRGVEQWALQEARSTLGWSHNAPPGPDLHEGSSLRTRLNATMPGIVFRAGA